MQSRFAAGARHVSGPTGTESCRGITVKDTCESVGCCSFKADLCESTVGDGPCENDEDLPPGWTKQFDQASQRSYYINQLLAKSQWNKPTANAADSTTAIPPPAGIVEGIAWRQFKRAQRNAGSVEQSRGGSGMGKLDVDDQVEVLKDGKDWRPAKIFRSLGNGLYAVKYE